MLSPRFLLSTMLVATVLMTQGCGDDEVTNPLTPELQQLKTSLDKYQDIDRASTDGWDTPITTCWYDHNQGAMGYHYGNVALIDGNASLDDPEALIYEPQQDGSMKLVALEYIVPLTAWQQSSPPRLVGHDFMRNDRVGVWAMHVWLWQSNPSGLYASWNPDVSCSHAAEKEDRAE